MGLNFCVEREGRDLVEHRSGRSEVLAEILGLELTGEHPAHGIEVIETLVLGPRATEHLEAKVPRGTSAPRAVLGLLTTNVGFAITSFFVAVGGVFGLRGGIKV
jgi:hypothetical protein